jgi:hypothetical protein
MSVRHSLGIGCPLCCFWLYLIIARPLRDSIEELEQTLGPRMLRKLRKRCCSRLRKQNPSLRLWA